MDQQTDRQRGCLPIAELRNRMIRHTEGFLTMHLGCREPGWPGRYDPEQAQRHGMSSTPRRCKPRETSS